MMIAQRGQQVGHTWMAYLPEPGDQLGLRVRGDIGQQFSHHILRVSLFEQPGPQVDEQPGPVLAAQFGILAVLMQPDRRVRAQHRLVERGPDHGHRLLADPVQHRAPGTRPPAPSPTLPRPATPAPRSRGEPWLAASVSSAAACCGLRAASQVAISASPSSTSQLASVASSAAASPRAPPPSTGTCQPSARSLRWIPQTPSLDSVTVSPLPLSSVPGSATSSSTPPRSASVSRAEDSSAL